MRRRRFLLAAVIAVLLSGAAAWRYQSELIGFGLAWYLERVAAEDQASGRITRRRPLIEGIHRRLLLEPPPEAMTAELYDVATLLASRIATGEVSLGWAAYLYTNYVRDLLEQRPGGTPRRTKEEIDVVLGQRIELFAIRKRPDVSGVRVGDLVGEGEDVITLEEIEAAEREGRELEVR